MFNLNSHLGDLKLLAVLALSLLSACSSIYKPQNVALKETRQGYHLGRFGDQHAFGETLLILSFSGGGTRAAALSYGVLKELRDTYLPAEHTRHRLLDEVDLISGVSGGSFTAAYYGLHGDDTFNLYEKVFLRQKIQSTLIRQLLTPTYWWRSLFSGFDRTEMAIEYYDTFVFNKATFNDMLLENHPFILINATDLSSGNRFSFTQDVFDLFCSDMGKLSVARAVTASSAVPVAFPPVVMENYAGTCDSRHSAIAQYQSNDGEEDPRFQDQRQSYLRYTERQERPFIHLVDGGISDNLGLRAAKENMDYIVQRPNFVDDLDAVKRVVLIMVNAEVRPSSPMDQSPEKPGIVETVDAVTNSQIRNYNLETKLLVSRYGTEIEAKTGKKFYFIDLNFQSFHKDTFKRFFNNLPTSLELKDSDVDSLISGGRALLRTSPEFRALLADMRGLASEEELTLEAEISPILEGMAEE